MAVLLVNTPDVLTPTYYEQLGNTTGVMSIKCSADYLVDIWKSQGVSGLQNLYDTTDIATSSPGIAFLALKLFSLKTACVAATTANVSVSAYSGTTLDGVSLTSGVSRILLKNQTNQAENWIYVYNGDGNALTRPTDSDTAAEVLNAIVYVSGGSTNSGKTYRQATTGTITLDTTNLAVSQFG